MSVTIFKRQTARQDLVDIFYHYATRGAVPTARRFLARAEATFDRLARMPGLGTRYEPDEPLYAELRFFPVDRFTKYVVFYRPILDGIEVFRVLHGARDIARILAEDFGLEAGDEPEGEGGDETND